MVKDLGYRRIQGTGRGSYIISLPKNWVQDSGLKKGSEVDFKIQDDSSLILIPRNILEGIKETESKTKEFTILVKREDDPESVCRKIISLYVVSGDLICIRFKEAALNNAWV